MRRPETKKPAVDKPAGATTATPANTDLHGFLASGRSSSIARWQTCSRLIETQVQGTDENIYLHKTVVATNNDIEQVKVVLDGRRMPAIAITFTDRGAKKIGEASDKYLGKRMAILVDGQAISAPTIRARISKRAEISGNFSHEEATRIAEALNAK